MQTGRERRLGRDENQFGVVLIERGLPSGPAVQEVLHQAEHLLSVNRAVVIENSLPWIIAQQQVVGPLFAGEQASAGQLRMSGRDVHRKEVAVEAGGPLAFR